MDANDPTEGHAAKCGGKTRSGEPCKNPAGYKTDHPGIGRCAFHLGATRTHQRAATLELARRECDRLGIPIEVDPGDALIGELWETAGNVAFYRALVQQLPTHPEPRKVEEIVGGQEDGAERVIPARAGVYGPTFHVSGMPTGEARPHILVQLYNEERKHLAAVASAALKAGVEERRVRMAEADATRILTAQVNALVAIGMGDKLEEFRRAFVTALRPDADEPLALGAGHAG